MHSSERAAQIRPVTSTYRVQLNHDFGFRDVTRLVPYLRRLGVSHLYASPIFVAVPGSSHGYDVIDPTRLNPELGTTDDFDKLIRSLHRHDMGLIIDIVPNHQATSAENSAWMSVLELGQNSPYAGYFDIEWKRDDGKVVLPILGRPLEEVLRAGEITLRHGDGRPEVHYYDHRLPVSPESQERFAGLISRGRADQKALGELLDMQHYRLVYWRDSADKINYRRFFDINDLIGVRVEDQDVFEATHQLIFALAASGAIDGLRVDHIDGPTDPAHYLQQLRDKLVALTGPARTYIVVEKILGREEELSADWRVQGTTGYDFLRVVNDVFVDPPGLARLKHDYSERLAAPCDFESTVYQAKRQIIESVFSGAFDALAKRIQSIAEQSTGTDGVVSSNIRAALVEVTCQLDVYRTYSRGGTMPPGDRRRVERAVASAQEQPNIDLVALALVRKALVFELVGGKAEESVTACQQVVSRWQQLSGAVMAKSVEDTAFYRYCPLLSLNDVGSDPNVPSDPVQAFHDWNLRAIARWPRTMTTTSTHDTKRGEDARARLNVLTEIPAEWNDATSHWMEMNRCHKREVEGAPAPDVHDELFTYQTICGVWPPDNALSDELRERLHTYLTKALREAKQRTSWREPNEPYEQATHEFLSAILDPARNAEFINDLSELVGRVNFAGTVNSLSQLLLKLTAAGVPDTYRGTEDWDLSLADPDNRRPVDFGAPRHLLNAMAHLDSGNRRLGEDVHSLVSHWQDGGIKLYLLSRVLNFRRKHPSLYLEGDYVPLMASGERASNVVAFARHHESSWSLTIAARLPAEFARQSAAGNDRSFWGNTTISLPANAPAQWHDLLTGASVRTVKQNGNTVDKLDHVFRYVPFALLEGTQ